MKIMTLAVLAGLVVFVVGSTSYQSMAQPTSSLVNNTGTLMQQSMNNTNATKTNTQTTNATTAGTTTNLTSTDTFSASGSISSIQLESLNASALMTTKSSPSSTTTQTNVIAAGNASSLSAITNTTTTASASQAAAAILPAKTFILSGFWHLNVNNGNISSFDVRFTKVHLDATNRHTHEITNLTLTDNKTSIKLNTNGTTTITGTTGVALNNIVVWKNVKTTITIINSSTIIISLDSKDTSNHFNGQSIYGVVDMVRDKNGNDIVHFPSIIHR